MAVLTAARPALALVTLAAIGVALRFTVSSPVAAPPEDGVPTVGPAPDGPAVPPAAADSLARLVAAHDLFRQGRAPAAVPFDPRTSGGEGAPPLPATPRPTLSLAGILFGAQPAALVDGLPGSDGTRVLHVGEHVGDLLVRRVARDHVIIASPDTVWTLRVRSPIP